MEAYELLMVISSIAIILLLTIQSWVLIKVMPLIKMTAHNSTSLKKIIGMDDNTSIESILSNTSYPNELKNQGLHNCKFPFDKTHIHIESCI